MMGKTPDFQPHLSANQARAGRSTVSPGRANQEQEKERRFVDVPPARDANACLAPSVTGSVGNKTNRGQDRRVVLPGHNTTISPTNRPPPPPQGLQGCVRR